MKQLQSLPAVPIPICRTRQLPPELEAIALRRSIDINPANAALTRSVERIESGRRGGLRRLALVTGRRWPASKTVLSVSFMDQPSVALRKRILDHMNAWNRTVSIRFEETMGTGEVRIGRFSDPPEWAGYWSWLGTEILTIPENEPTLNLEAFTMKTSEAEFKRVVRHETGHTLGFDHEHMRTDLVARIDRKKAIAYFRRTEGWSAKETQEQVLTPLAEKSLMGTTESDPLSIMCYQIPGEITKDGKAIPGGTDINENDFAFAAKIYPKEKGKSRLDSQAPQSQIPEDPAPVHSAASLSSEPGAETFAIVILDEFPQPMKGKKPGVARVYASYAGAQVMGSLRLNADDGGNATAFGRIIAMHKRIQDYTNREKGSLPDDEGMREFGELLFNTLIHGDVLRLYDEARARQQNRKLDVVLTSMIDWIAEKPWEYAYDRKRGSYLATEDVHFVRNVFTAVPAHVHPAQPGPLRILVAAAQPVGLVPLSIEHEVEVIRRGFEPLIEAGMITVEVLPRATPGRLHGKLSTGRYAVVHFIGHSVFNDETQEGELMFEDERGNEQRMGIRSAREIFCKRGVNLVFLNSCQSGAGSLKNFNQGTAQSLIQHGMPVVVANQYSVLDSSATTFAQQFYWALAQGMSVGQAACESRIAVNYALGGDNIDWAVPVLYTRSPGLTLCEPTGAEVPSPVTAARRSVRQLIRDRARRVAVWDMDNVFPMLAGTLEKMTTSQDVFGLELVSLSIPINAWDLESKTDSPDGSPYLWAEKLSRQLKGVIADLRVDVLVCVTRHWMCDDKTLNLFNWWGDRNVPVAIFSCAGFEELSPAGAITDRVVCNAIVSSLAGFLGDIGTHEHGARNCPMFYNPDRDFGHLAGRQRFDSQCRTFLKKALPVELPALEALLHVFD